MWTNRSGKRWYAPVKVKAWRSRWPVGLPKWMLAGVWYPSAAWRCCWLYQGKNSAQNACACQSEAKRRGEAGRYLGVLNSASEEGLSLD